MVLVVDVGLLGDVAVAEALRRACQPKNSAATGTRKRSWRRSMRRPATPSRSNSSATRPGSKHALTTADRFLVSTCDGAWSVSSSAWDRCSAAAWASSTPTTAASSSRWRAKWGQCIRTRALRAPMGDCCPPRHLYRGLGQATSRTRRPWSHRGWRPRSVAFHHPGFRRLHQSNLDGAELPAVDES